jgi:hypothetical protein
MLINFEEQFRAYLHEYMHSSGLNEDEVENQVPELYLKWLDMPQKWLSGKSPNAYFEAMDPGELVTTLGQYMLSDMPVPGPLLNRIADANEDTYPLLVSLMQNYEGEKGDEIRTIIVKLIEEMDMPRPFAYYIDVVAKATAPSEFSEACVEELKNAGEAYTKNVISAYEAAQSPYAADCLLDILADMPYDERSYEFALEKFLYSETNKAFYASCLGKLGSEKALPYLEEVLRQDGIRYYDYVSIKNAVEELGGEVMIDRDFTGDKDYESLINMED